VRKERVGVKCEWFGKEGESAEGREKREKGKNGHKGSRTSGLKCVKRPLYHSAMNPDVHATFLNG
jgi:hypothetical protein